MIHDLVVDTFDDDVLVSVLETLGNARLMVDPERPGEPYLTPDDGYLVVRIKDGNPEHYAREVQRRVRGLRVVDIFARTPKEAV